MLKPGMFDYDFELERVLEEVARCGAGVVELQFPEDLKEDAVLIAAEIEDKTEAKVIVFIDQTYGACTQRTGRRIERLGIDLLVHFGHTEFMK